VSTRCSAYLIAQRDRVVTRSDILNEVWEDAGAVYPRTVDVHVGNLRKKLEDDPAEPRWIVGVRGVGYRFTG
jgi:DNA-binding response OmpR family regulator